MSNKTLLNDEIKNEIEGLSRLQVGTEEHKQAVDSVTKLMVQANELEKSEFEKREKIESREIETELKLKQLEEDKKDRWVRNSIALAGVVLPLVVTIWGTKASFKFEETGTITTTMGRGFLNKLLPKK